MSTLRGETIGLLTQHGKLAVIAAAMQPALGCEVVLVSGFDTDSLGTFTGDVARQGTQIEAARRKARMAITLSGHRVGLGSEGSFGPDPYTGLMPWNIEMLCLIDDRTGVEVVGMAQGPAHDSQTTASDWDAARAFAERELFPMHHLILRPGNAQDPRIIKGIDTWARYQEAFDTCLAQAENGQVFIETDLRAFANPTRMAVIGQAAHDLARRLKSTCPACEAAGYWITERVSGLPCAQCLYPTPGHVAETWRCVRCAHQETRARTDRRTADPSTCPRCNP